MKTIDPFILASSSPRRKRLLQKAGFNFYAIDSKIIEIHLRLGNMFGDWLDTGEATTLIPAWRSKYEQEAEQRKLDGWKFREDYDHGFSYIEEPRLGFWYK